MANITFLGKKFESERERNAYAFQNKDELIAQRNYSMGSIVGGSLIFGFMLGLLLAVLTANLSLIWFCIIGMLILVIVVPRYEKINIKMYSTEYESFLIKTEKEIRKDILEPFIKRYFTDEQKLEHISDLVNLINHKKNLSFTEKEGLFLLSQFGIEHNFSFFDKEISGLKDKSSKNFAKMLVKISPNINFEEKEDYEDVLKQFCESLQKKSINFDSDILEREVVSEYKRLKAEQFEGKLSRNSNNKISVEEIEHLDGFEFEQLIGNLFKKAGYKVKVTKKTGDQGADIIVEKDGVSTAIQAKKYSGSVGNKAVQEIVAAVKYYDCDKAMVITTGNFTKGAYELASRNGVQLIDRKALNELFDSIL